jgi:hypothetical protein
MDFAFSGVRICEIWHGEDNVIWWPRLLIELQPVASSRKIATSSLDSDRQQEHT